MAQVADQQIGAKFNHIKSGLANLGKSRGDLVAIIPASNARKDLSSNPLVVTIQKCLDDLSQI